MDVDAFVGSPRAEGAARSKPDAMEEAAGVIENGMLVLPVPYLRLLFALAYNTGIQDGAEHGAVAAEKTKDNVEGYMRAAEDWPDLWRVIREAKAKTDP